MALFEITKKNNLHAFEIRNSGAFGATSRVILELKPFGISIRGSSGSEPWVGRSTVKMSRSSTCARIHDTQFKAGMLNHLVDQKNPGSWTGSMYQTFRLVKK